ncbi:related to SIW14-Tyrosine phosphatase involved in actin filamentorganization [Sporisorium reilianum f. sp. reilianum]|uniref:Related to SIW14-Tyrosine phosphatase involved in actin filamentorganization n=1 Tax=Sporisorium reilianum f. sp. reilianum TaxID=72559 RepID=A0A2N8UFV1_9BASI|nr:related to SIW14-Tyrosine phosphatase involved in actin filamentorganization [Sporisorium reilianum f. sp. reilianum]
MLPVESKGSAPASTEDARDTATTTAPTAPQPSTPNPAAPTPPPTAAPPPSGPKRTTDAPPAATLPSLLTSTSPTASSAQLIVPPLNFSMVSRGIYRSGHPNERNFEFLRRLNLKSVLYLGTEDYRANMTAWTAAQHIRTFHLRLAINKEPTAEMDEADVVQALQLILRPENWPILIHCNKGKYRVGCVVGLLRRLQGWSHTSIFEEYSRFAGTKISDLEFIEVFDLDKVTLGG